ncbi:MAG: sugar phosphate isomerase/epimerase [Verrucomicrobia bacterium]|nr:sugar phosphate isomerase/epimerase [Verrucomicrobiota bacterium]
MPDHYQFSIPIGAEDFAEKIAFAKEHQFGIEVAAFASGPALEDEQLRTRIERRLTTALRGFPGRLSYHGAFIDLAVHSADPAIAAVARDRIERDLETASRLGCQMVVFHTGFNPLVPVRQYEDEFVERHAVFWPQMAEAWPRLQIALENMWEPSPQIFERLLRAIHHPRLGLCLDVAHAHAYSDFGVETWLDRLRARITHMHWNDNHGDPDSLWPSARGIYRGNGSSLQVARWPIA